FFAQVFYNASNAGNASATDDNGTFYLRTGLPVVDNSTVLVGQLQQGFNLGEAKFTAGADYIATTPVTEGTIMGRNEQDDNITEAGAYLQMTRPLSERLELTAAIRSDVNSRLDGEQFSPRAALVYSDADAELPLDLQPRLRVAGLVLVRPRSVLRPERQPWPGARERSRADLRKSVTARLEL
ncbi:MAG: hypothetical protein RLZZ93_1187, partial [Actinomycetota bacterium]